jgi:hypothetical protein
MLTRLQSNTMARPDDCQCIVDPIIIMDKMVVRTTRNAGGLIVYVMRRDAEVAA